MMGEKVGEHRERERRGRKGRVGERKGGEGRLPNVPSVLNLPLHHWPLCALILHKTEMPSGHLRFAPHCGSLLRCRPSLGSIP